MRVIRSNKGVTSLQVGAAIVAALLLLFMLIVVRHDDSRWLKTAFEQSVKKAHLVQAMKSELLASAEAEKSAVMADTDEASAAFAEQSAKASQNVAGALVELKPLIEENSKETKLLDDFSVCWVKLRDLDKEILSLAVQNTNLKALRLCFVPAAASIRQMEQQLNQLMDSVAPSPDSTEILRLASKALVGTLNIYALEAPHIAATTEAEMDGIESKMRQLDEQVRLAMSSLNNLAAESEKPLVGEARKTYLDFQTINAEIIELSRRNSNIRSFAVSLGQKRNAMA